MYENPLWRRSLDDHKIIDSCWYGKRMILAFFFYCFVVFLGGAFLFAKLTRNVIKKTAMRSYLAVIVGYIPYMVLAAYLDRIAIETYGEEVSVYPVFWLFVHGVNAISPFLIIYGVFTPIILIVSRKIYIRNEDFWDRLVRRVGSYLKFVVYPIGIPFFIFRRIGKSRLMDSEILAIVSVILSWLFYTVSLSALFVWQYLPYDIPFSDHVWYLQILAVLTVALWGIIAIIVIPVASTLIVFLTGERVVVPMWQKVKSRKSSIGGDEGEEVTRSTPGLLVKAMKAIKNRTCVPIEVVD